MAVSDEKKLEDFFNVLLVLFVGTLSGPRYFLLVAAAPGVEPHGLTAVVPLGSSATPRRSVSYFA